MHRKNKQKQYRGVHTVSGSTYARLTQYVPSYQILDEFEETKKKRKTVKIGRLRKSKVMPRFLIKSQNLEENYDIWQL